MLASLFNRNFGKLLVVLSFLSCGTIAMAQRIALKTNTFYWATLSPNVEAEFRLSRHFTLDLGATANFSTKIDDNNLKFLQVAPELRYWFSRPMARHYVGITTFAANYNLKLGSTYYDGDAVAVGFTYGFDWVISRRWNIETSIGAGLLKYRCFEYVDSDVKPLSPNTDKTILAPLKLGVSISYLLF